MKYKRHQKINRYKKIRLREYAIVFCDSEQLIDFICDLNNENITNSSLYTKDGYYMLLISTTKAQNISNYATFKDNLHINKIKQNSSLICNRDAVHKMQKAFIKT